jgi:hypothetical protein
MGIQDALQKYAVLMQEYSNMRNDYVSEKDIRRKYQNENSIMQGQLQDTKHHIVS